MSAHVHINTHSSELCQETVPRKKYWEEMHWDIKEWLFLVLEPKMVLIFLYTLFSKFSIVTCFTFIIKKNYFIPYFPNFL